MNGQAKHFYTFGPFVLDAAQHVVLRDGKPVPLSPKAVDTLLLLVCNAGHLVEKDDLMKELWPNAFVEEGNLTKNIFVLRKALGNGDLGREYIETVPKRGYRFVAAVSVGYRTEITPGSQPPAVATPAFDGNDLTALSPALEAKISSASKTAVESRRGDPLQMAAWWGAAVLAAVALAALAGWFWLSPSPQPTVVKLTQITHFGRVASTSRLATDGTRIYFEELRGGRSTLAAVPIDGGEPVPVPAPFTDFELYGISPDHSELLIGSEVRGQRDQLFWMLPTTGGSPRRLGNVLGHSAAWSLDGQKIAYFTGSDLYVVKADGSDSRKLATIEGRGSIARWSPDGQVLRFSAWGMDTRTLSLWEVSSSGGNPHPLLPGWGAPRVRNFGDGESDGDWTADGKYFVFRSTRAGVTSIWAISEGRKFLFQRSPAPVQLMPTDSYLWSLLAARNKIFYTGDKDIRELARYDARTKQFVPYFPGVRAVDVDFSPDAQWVTYIVTTWQESDVWRSRADGSERQQLTFPPMIARQPRWSPDGKQIAFVGEIEGNPRRLFLVSPEGGEPQPVTTVDSLYPDWSHGGDLLFFTAAVPASVITSGPEHAGTNQLDLRTKQLSVFPGAEAVMYSRWSPDGRYLVGETRDSRKLMLFDSQSRQWSELAHRGILRAAQWSHNSKYAYSQDVHEAGQPIFRVRISDHKIERITTFEQILRDDVRSYSLVGVAPDGSPLVSLALSHSDIYALDIDFP